MAAENFLIQGGDSGRIPGFNEAAANGRGKHRRGRVISPAAAPLQ